MEINHQISDKSFRLLKFQSKYMEKNASITRAGSHKVIDTAFTSKK